MYVCMYIYMRTYLFIQNFENFYSVEQVLNIDIFC